jgi:hypothetical protein
MIVTSEKTGGEDTIKTYEFDGALSRELRETEKQIAIELKLRRAFSRNFGGIARNVRIISEGFTGFS